MINYILINDLATLVWSANMANLEIHPFLSKAPNIDVPTMVVFDLDPGDQTNILKSCKAALLVKAVLDKLNLKSLVKVSGSKGIHMHVPLNTEVTYEMTQAFARTIAQFLEREHPGLIVSEMAKEKRKGKSLHRLEPELRAQIHRRGLLSESQRRQTLRRHASHLERAKKGRPKR